MTLLYIVCAFLVSSVTLFILFATVVKLEAFVKGKATWLRDLTILGWSPWIVTAILRDALFQYTWGTIIFLEWPPKGEYMLTWRLTRHKRAGLTDGWRYKLAMSICTLIEKIQPGHCR